MKEFKLQIKCENTNEWVTLNNPFIVLDINDEIYCKNNKPIGGIVTTAYIEYQCEHCNKKHLFYLNKEHKFLNLFDSLNSK